MIRMNIYVGNVSFKLSDDELREALEDSPMRPRMSGEGSRLSPTKMRRNKGSQSHLLKGSRSTGTLRSPNTYANYS